MGNFNRIAVILHQVSFTPKLFALIQNGFGPNKDLFAPIER